MSAENYLGIPPGFSSAELQQSEARFMAAFQSSAIGMGILGLDGKILQVNDAVCRISGYSREELLQRYDQQNVHPDDAAVGQEQYSRLLKGELDHFQVEKRYRRKSGEVFWARLTLSAVRGSDGHPLYLVGMLEDVDDQKLAQKSLTESEARFRAMFDNSSVGITLIAPDRRVLMVNPAVVRMSGYSEKEILEMIGLDMTYPEDREIGNLELIEIIQGTRNTFQIEKRYIHKGGRIYWTRLNLSAVRDASGKLLYLTAITEDIDEQKRAAEKLASQETEYRRTLEQRVEERTLELKNANLRLVAEIEERLRVEEALASKAAEEAILAERTRLARDLHDAVTQTLFSASLIAEVLPDLWQVDPEEARKSNEELRQLTRGALAEMRALLLELRPAALTQARLPELLKQLSEAITGRARLPVELSIVGDFELPPDVKVAFYRITQESLNNVVKYSRATRVEIRIQLDCCSAHLEIKDNGTGFDTSSLKPTSLGMRIMRERAEAINATFEVVSSPGAGTTVRIDWNDHDNVSPSILPNRGKS